MSPCVIELDRDCYFSRTRRSTEPSQAALEKPCLQQSNNCNLVAILLAFHRHLIDSAGGAPVQSNHDRTKQSSLSVRGSHLSPTPSPCRLYCHHPVPRKLSNQSDSRAPLGHLLSSDHARLHSTGSTLTMSAQRLSIAPSLWLCCSSKILASL